ncbi:MAG TPA: protein kinase, partial [Caldimonas sp.]|nr:protein kinase [Caldimonas sp.]
MDDRPRRPMADWSRTTAPASPRARQAPDEPARGDTIGRFIVLDVLGSGGMAVVYSAHDPHLDRKVALKLLRTDAPAQADDVRTRLVREAQAMARIDHPNVIKVHEVGTHGDGVYIAMEYAEGGTLRGWLEQQTRSQRDVIGLFVQAGRGLAAAH